MGQEVYVMIILILLAVIGVFYYSQVKLQGKLHCTFHRKNKTIIEKFVPLSSNAVRFATDGIMGRYEISPRCIEMRKYNKGINMLFPTFVPSLTFRWDTPYPLNPEDFEVTWHSPELRDASWQEHQQVAFSRGIAAQTGAKKRFPDWFLPAISIVLILLVGFLVYQMSQQITYLQQQINLIQ